MIIDLERRNKRERERERDNFVVWLNDLCPHHKRLNGYIWIHLIDNVHITRQPIFIMELHNIVKHYLNSNFILIVPFFPLSGPMFKQLFRDLLKL